MSAKHPSTQALSSAKTLERDPLGLSFVSSTTIESRRHLTEVWDNFKGNPREVVVVFRGLIEKQRLLHAVSPESIDEDFERLAQYLSFVMVAADDLGAGTWSLFFEAGIHTVYLDALLATDLGIWNKNKDSKWTLTNMLSAFAQCVGEAVRYPATADEVVRRVPSLLRFLWQGREHFDLKWLDTYGFQPYDEPMPEQNVVNLLHRFYYTYVSRCRSQPTLETYVPQLATYFWTKMTRRDKPVVFCLTMLKFLLLFNGDAAAVVERFAKEVLIDIVGADKFLDRAAQELRCVDHPDDLTNLLARILAELTRNAPCLKIYLKSRHPFPDAVVATSRLATNSGSPPQDRVGVMMSTMALMWHAQQNPPSNYRSSDVFDALTLGIDLLLAGNDYAYFRDSDRESFTNIVHDLACLTQQGAARQLKGADQQKAYEDTKEAAPTSWWPNLRRLRTAQYRTGELRTYDELILWWIRLGEVVFLDEETERARFEEKALHHCSWSDCEFFFSKKESRTDLRVCSGCQQARYCSKSCQISDWSKGGHKARCRRLRT